MDLQKSTDEIVDDICREVYEKLYGTGARSLDHYRAELSKQFTERDIKHDLNKKYYDKQREKYFKIDVLVPSMERFLVLKFRKHITRADMNQFRQQEVSIGVKGLMVNFFNGVDVRETTSLLPGEEKRQVARDVPKFRGGPRSSSVDKLPGIRYPKFAGSRSWGGSSSMVSGGSSGFSSTAAAANVDFAQIFAASCASFFISEGDRATFASTFNDFLTQMSIKRLNFPRRRLNGDPLQKPQGVLNENLDYFFKSSSIATSIRKKNLADDDKEANNSEPSSTSSEYRMKRHYRKLPAIGSASSTNCSTSKYLVKSAVKKGDSSHTIGSADVPVILAAVCAAFYLAEGDPEEFYYAFAEFLKLMNIGHKPTRGYQGRYPRSLPGDEHSEDEDPLAPVGEAAIQPPKLPPKKVIDNLKVLLIGGDSEIKEDSL